MGNDSHMLMDDHRVVLIRNPDTGCYWDAGVCVCTYTVHTSVYSPVKSSGMFKLTPHISLNISSNLEMSPKLQTSFSQRSERTQSSLFNACGIRQIGSRHFDNEGSEVILKHLRLQAPASGCMDPHSGATYCTVCSLVRQREQIRSLYP